MKGGNILTFTLTLPVQHIEIKEEEIMNGGAYLLVAGGLFGHVVGTAVEYGTWGSRKFS